MQIKSKESNLWRVKHSHSFGVDVHIIQSETQPPDNVVVAWAKENLGYNTADGDDLTLESQPLNVLV